MTVWNGTKSYGSADIIFPAGNNMNVKIQVAVRRFFFFFTNVDISLLEIHYWHISSNGMKMGISFI